MKKKSENKRIVYMLRTKPKYQFPLTDEEREELNYFVSKVYNPLMSDNLGESYREKAHA